MRFAGSRRDVWFTLASVACVVLTIVAVSVSFFTFDRFAEFLFNADAIQTPAVFADVFGRGGAFFDWSIAPAPAIVPEYGMFALAYAIGGTYEGRVLAYSIIQILVFWATSYGVAWAAGIRRPLIAASLIVSTFGLFCMWRIMNFTQLIQSAFHFGGFILQLVALALILLLWRRRAGRSRGATVGLVAGIMALALVASLNDALFVVQLAAPVCLIVGVGVIAKRIPWRPGLGFASLLALASLLGWRLYPLVFAHPTSTTDTIKPEEFGHDVETLIEVWGYSFARSPLAVVIVAFALVCAAAGAVLLLRRRDVSWMRGTTLQTLAVFGLLSGTLLFLAAFLTDIGTSPRYAMPLFYWPVILGAFLLMQCEWRHALVVATSLACVASLVSMSVAVRDVVRVGLSDSYYTSTAACLDDAAHRFGVTHAIGTYWVAKPTQEFSRSGLTVTVLTRKLEPRRWVATVANSYPAYDAFVDEIANPDESMRRILVKRFGKPRESVTCGPVKMWVWPRGAIDLSSAQRG